MGQSTSEHVRRLFFGAPTAAARRLAKLVALKMLDVHLCAQSDPNVYTLGSRGLALLLETGADPTELHRSRVGSRLDDHLRLLNDLRVEFVLAARHRPDVGLIAFHSDLDLRRAAGASPPSYIPDALVELELSGADGPRQLVLVGEIDTGSEGVSVFATKVRRTVELWSSRQRCWGAPPGAWRPAAFVPSPARARALARSAAGEGGGALWLVGEFDRVGTHGAFGPVFATADEIVATPRAEVILYRGALIPPAP